MTTLNKKLVRYFVALITIVSIQTSSAQEMMTPQKEPPPKKYFARLRPEGDYSKLSFCIQSNKKEYRLGEPIFIRAAIRNDSASNISFCAGNAPVNYLNANKIEIVDSKNRPIERTRYRRLRQGDEENGEESYMEFSANAFQWLMPGETIVMEIRPLSVYYDFSHSGKYRITYYRRAVTWIQNIDPPLKSNTIEVTVQPFLFQPDHLVAPGDFGCEPVFQKTDGKNVSDIK